MSGRVIEPGVEAEIIDGIHRVAIVRVRERAEVSEIGVQMWRVDWVGVRPLLVREDFMRSADSGSEAK